MDVLRILPNGFLYEYEIKKSDEELRELKILKKGEQKGKVFVSHPFAVDNYDAIIKKLTK